MDGSAGPRLLGPLARKTEKEFWESTGRWKKTKKGGGYLACWFSEGWCTLFFFFPGQQMSLCYVHNQKKQLLALNSSHPQAKATLSSPC